MKACKHSVGEANINSEAKPFCVTLNVTVECHSLLQMLLFTMMIIMMNAMTKQQLKCFFGHGLPILE